MVGFCFRYEGGIDLRVFSTVEGAYRFAARIMDEHSYDMETFEPSMVLEGQGTLEDHKAMLDEWNDHASMDGMEIVIQNVVVEE
ncbi:MAG: hypothetical protein EBT07_14830 [Actinobacteria bacterium]|nr:hypothetical protein [Actinomycetota bacterium]